MRYIGVSSYIFFENRTGFNFVSLEYLYKSATTQEFVYDGYMRDFTADGRTVRNVEEEYKRIIEISIPNVYDYIDRAKSGMFASKMTSYDLTKKQYNVKLYSMLDDFDNNKHLNDYSVASAKSIFRTNSFAINYPRANSTFSGFGDATNYRNELKRLSMLKVAEANKIQIVVPGRCDYTVGQKVNIKLYKVEPLSDKDVDNLDKMFSGNYLIGAVNHYVDREKHECHMELIKDSLTVSLDKGGTK